jgi:hypothetical protein
MDINNIIILDLKVVAIAIVSIVMGFFYRN